MNRFLKDNAHLELLYKSESMPLQDVFGLVNILRLNQLPYQLILIMANLHFLNQPSTLLEY